ncbi:MAG: iron-containing redox enzyme family protein [Planctomycetota bacterium]
MIVHSDPTAAEVSTLEATVQRVLDEAGHADNPYFVALRDGSFAFDDFVETQVQFYFVVQFFSRPMATVAAKIPSAELRLEVLRNVWEEHGEGDLSRAHGATFREFLLRLAGLRPDELEARALWPEARLFDTALAGASALDEWIVGVAMLGMIERMFVDISSWIGRGVVERSWLAEERMVHYDLHETLDVKHSQDFFDVLRSTWDEEPAARYYVEQGLRLGATAFDTLYRGLYRARGRRALAPERAGPHARS